MSYVQFLESHLFTSDQYFTGRKQGERHEKRLNILVQVIFIGDFEAID
jgi:hypothetical protein